MPYTQAIPLPPISIEIYINYAPIPGKGRGVATATSPSWLPVSRRLGHNFAVRFWGIGERHVFCIVRIPCTQTSL